MTDSSLNSQEFHGRNAVVTGAAGGIGLAAAEMIMARGGKVLGLDLSSNAASVSDHPNWRGVTCDVTSPKKVAEAIQAFVSEVGELHMLVSNAGIFTAGQPIQELPLETWDKSILVNLTSHFLVMKEVLAHMTRSGEGSIVVIGSRNVKAPGPGAAAYSVAKAGLTQLARVAALELGPENIRVNVVHPDAVFNTGLWTTEALESSAARYNITVEEYMKNNVLKVDVRLSDVASAIGALLGSGFARTTGAQIPVDGGNIRVI
jgi:NAD(P)-dependent dehydrogenase (short-subunit alcohol dehydrogenase family)|tara:strand:- start:296 stop:1078 length:783 start_codon:yes stop_codon:yes gene_type:complete